MDLTRCQCPACKSAELELEAGCPCDLDAVHEGAIRCRACGAGYDVIWGVPYLGVFEAGDFLSLLEVAACVEGYHRTASTSAVGKAYLEDAHRMLEEYHRHPTKRDYQSADGRQPQSWGWWDNRWHEHVLIRALLQGVPLAGKAALDVGAGTGFDSFRLVRAGCEVTALDFNPLLLCHGRRALPAIHWVGGSSRVLPFRTGAFDVVLVNAALHHMRDLPVTVEELLRVLKPGGTLLTLCDSYSADQSPEAHELEVFNDHPAVLQGVNECLPHFRQFLSSLVKHRKHLDVRVFTQAVYGLATPGAGPFMEHPTEWDLDRAMRELPTTSGCLALAVRKREAFSTSQPRQGEPLIGCGAFANGLDAQAVAVALLARRVAPDRVNLPLLAGHHDKFVLLNGWKKPEPGRPYRTCYRRARAFLSRAAHETHAHLELLVPHHELSGAVHLRLFLDGQEVSYRPVTRGLWTRHSVRLDRVPVGQPFLLEIRLEAGATEDPAQLFRVRGLDLDGVRPEQTPSAADLDSFGLEAIRELGLLGHGPVSVLLSTDYKLGLEVINRLRVLGHAVEAIVAAGQRAFYAGEPGVSILETYEDLLWREGTPRPLTARPLLVAAPDARAASDLLPLLPSPGTWRQAFFVRAGGYAEPWPPALTEPAARDENRGRGLKTLLTKVKRRLSPLVPQGGRLAMAYRYLRHRADQSVPSR